MSLWLCIVIASLIGLFIEYILRKLKIKHNEKRYILVTGCDSGFGNIVTKKLDVLGFRVFAGCLTKAGIEDLTNVCSWNVVAIELDVTKDESIDQAMEIVKLKIGHPDKGLWAVVNNAGIVGEIGPTAWQTRACYEKTLSVNLYGVIMVTKACMPLILKEKGRIINTTSVMGRIAFADATYCVSKYGVEAFSDILRRENYQTGVSVHIIEPGFYLTPLINKEVYRRRVEAKLKSLPPAVSCTLPADIVHLLTDVYNRVVDRVASPNTTDVPDAYIHAITSRFPKKRYLVGADANYVFRPLWMLPEWFSDWLIVKPLLKR